MKDRSGSRDEDAALAEILRLPRVGFLERQRASRPARSSPMVPDTMMKGVSLPDAFNTFNAARESNCSTEWSETTRSQVCCVSAACMAAVVSTQSQTGS